MPCSPPRYSLPQLDSSVPSAANTSTARSVSVFAKMRPCLSSTRQPCVLPISSPFGSFAQSATKCQPGMVDAGGAGAGAVAGAGSWQLPLAANSVDAASIEAVQSDRSVRVVMGGILHVGQRVDRRGAERRRRRVRNECRQHLPRLVVAAVFV